MSWDVMIFRFKGVPPTSTNEIDAANMIPLGVGEEVRRQISTALPNVDWSDANWGILEDAEFSIEFNTGGEDPIKSIMLHVRGGGNAIPTIMAFVVPAGWSALDCSTCNFLDPLRPSDEGWQKFQVYRDRVIKGRTPNGEG